MLPCQRAECDNFTFNFRCGCMLVMNGYISDQGKCEYYRWLIKKYTTHNSDYASAFPKLPSFESLKEYMNIDNELKEIEILCIYNAIKKLGNFR